MFEIFAILGVTLLVVATVVVPLVWRAGAGASTVGVAKARTTTVNTRQSASAVPIRSPHRVADGQDARPPELAGDAAEGDFTSIEGIEGRIDGSAHRKMKKIVERHPDEALSVVRRWMEEDR
ncbi:MAG: hypothetical protein QF902_06510 [Rhodospirillales bacterium]|jgi:flagellar M-ring protein FliF|nr:hypothetical protein [Rhodospirillales bacterium]